MAEPKSPIAATDTLVAERQLLPLDIDGASVVSRASLYSYSSRRSRGYRTEAPKAFSSSASSHRPRRYSSSAADHGDCAGSVTSVGSGGSRSRSRSRGYGKQNRERGQSRSQSHDRYTNYYERSVSRDRYYDGSHEDDRRSRHEDDSSWRRRPNSYHGDASSSRRPRDLSPSRSQDRRRTRSRSEGSRGDWSTSRGRSSSHARHQSSDDWVQEKAPTAREWPPCFENEGSAFLFDVRSSMFYEALSDFFYDPKSKLYYGNKKGAYFRYDETTDPPFVEVQKVAKPTDQAGVSQEGSTGNDVMEQVALASLSGKEPSNGTKPKIAIKLKTKKIKSAPAKPVSNGGQIAIPKVQKEQIANIEKWTEKQAELKHSGNPDLPPPSTNKGDTKASPLASAVGQTSKVRMTAKGEPICLVCKRKFPNLEKLRLHEKASELHQQNLRKLQEEGSSRNNKRKLPEPTAATRSAEVPVMEYQDRAEKRRQLNGHHESTMLNGGLGLSLQPFTPRAAPVALDESNIGHQMLKKFGWKGDNSKSSTNGHGHQLRKEWDRIEALAGNPSRPSNGGL